jgi:hypothetical protein
MSVNQKLSRERSEAPEPIIDRYLVNVPHRHPTLDTRYFE